MDPIRNATLEQLDEIASYGAGTDLGGKTYYPEDAFRELMRRYEELMGRTGHAPNNLPNR